MILVPFRITIPEERQDKLLVQRLKNELPGIFLWAVEGLRRLSLNGQFTEPAVCKEALDQYKIENNPCREFLEDHYEYDATAVTKTQDAYGNYTQWARSRGVEVLSDTEFGKEVCRAFAQVTKKKRGGRKARYSEYIGLKARPLYDFAENALRIGGELRVERLVGPPVGPFPRPPQDTEQQDVDDE